MHRELMDKKFTQCFIGNS